MQRIVAGATYAPAQVGWKPEDPLMTRLIALFTAILLAVSACANDDVTTSVDDSGTESEVDQQQTAEDLRQAIQILTSFDGLSAENVTMDKNGVIYVSATRAHQVWTVSSSGDTEVFATIGDGSSGTGPGTTGVGAHEDGSIYSAAATEDPDSNGFWPIESDGTSAHIPGPKP